MQLIQNGTQAPGALPTKQPASGTPGYGYGGPPGATPASRWDPDVANTLLAELVAIATDLGDDLDPTNNAQVLSALRRYCGGYVTGFTSSAVLAGSQAGLIELNATGGGFTIGLPLANSLNGRPFEFRFMRTDGSTNVVTVQRSGSDIFAPGGFASIPIIQNGYLAIQSDGSNWIIKTPNHFLSNVTVDGSATVAANVSVGGNVWSGGYAQITQGAVGTGDPSRVVSLGDYYVSTSGPNILVRRDPDGFMRQVTAAVVPWSAGASTTTIVTLPSTFGSIIASGGNFDGNAPQGDLAVCFQSWSTSQVSVTTNSVKASGSGNAGVVIWAEGIAP